MAGFADNEYAIDVWASFDGIAHQDEASFQFIGICRAPPMHQGMQGRETTESGFALQVGGSRTLLCRSRQTIPIGSHIVWKIPREDGLPADTSKHGRLLAEFCAYKPSDALLEPHMVHRMVKDVTGNKIDLSHLHASDRAAHQNAMRMWEGFRAIAFSAVAVYLKNKKGANANQLDSDLTEAAEMFGLAKISNSDAEYTDKVKRWQETSDDLLDTILQSETDERTGNSVSSPNKTSFPMTIDGSYNPNIVQAGVAAKQAVQYRTIYDTMLTMWDQLQSRKIGWTMNGGHPGGDMDVILRRTA
jgi:hypothetical protein